VSITNTFLLIELARKLKIGPLSMDDIQNHTAKNLAAFTVLTVLIGLSVSVFSGGINISILGAGFVSLISSVVVGFIGVLVNLALPTPKDSSGATSQKDTNKFVTYAILAFLATVATFVAIGLVFLFAIDDINSLVDLLTVNYLWSYNNATLLTSLLSATIGTCFLYTLLLLGKRIVITRFPLTLYIVSTILICGIVFHVSHFIILS